jgi:ferredoxin
LICYNVIKSGTRRKIKMAFKITDDCISCGACEAECPVGAIAEGDGKYEIDADACVSCGACADACPVAAPVEE